MKIRTHRKPSTPAFAMTINTSATKKRARQIEQEGMSDSPHQFLLLTTTEPLRRIRRVRASGEDEQRRPHGPPCSEPEARKRPLDPEDSFASPGEPALKKTCLSEPSPSHNRYAIEYWQRSGSWPNEYFEPDTMSDIFAKPSLRRKRSEAGSLVSASTPSAHCSREEKAAAYKDPRYDAHLELKGVHLGLPTERITSKSKAWCDVLLNTEQTVPENSVFQDGSFAKLYNNIRGRNEARIVQDIARLVVPSAESLYFLGAEELSYLTESVNDGWNNAIALVGPRPQPDYSVGFNRKAFSARQHLLLAPYVGNYPSNHQSYFMASWYMHFPFLASEVKCGSGGLEVADRQNAHSMTLAVRAVVALFRKVGRVNEVDKEILAFSVSHDSQNVRIYGHFPIINGDEVLYYRHPIDSYDLTVSEGEKRWTAYKFVINLYKRWVPQHLELLRSAIDALPYTTDHISAGGAQKSTISKGTPTQPGSSMASADPVSDDVVEAGPPTPDTSFSEQAPCKRRKA